jgi:hypothetical protein
MNDENNNELEKFIDYEKAFAELFRELRLKPAQCGLIRAFLAISEGKTEFETSYQDLAKVNNKIGDNERKILKKFTDNTRNAFKVLNDWQIENKLTLIEQVEIGRRINNSDGTFTYQNSKYRFVFLEELNKTIFDNPKNAVQVIKKTIDELKKQPIEDKKAKSYHPRYWMKVAKKTIQTKLRKAFLLAITVGDNPVLYCQGILNDGWKTLSDLETEYKATQNRDEFIADFENELNDELFEDFNLNEEEHLDEEIQKIETEETISR